MDALLVLRRGGKIFYFLHGIPHWNIETFLIISTVTVKIATLSHINFIKCTPKLLLRSCLSSLCFISLDVERKPDVVLTTSSKILVSNASVCNSCISLGTENNNIMTWDKLTGTTLSLG